MDGTRYKEARLSGGLRVGTAWMPWMRSACLGIYAGVGSRHEAAPLAGLAHFAEHMLFKGTPTRSPLAITQAVEGVGGQINAFTAEDHTAYHAQVPAEFWREAGAVLADLYGHSLFPEQEIEREREVILEEIVMYREQPSQHIEDLHAEAMWPGSSLGRPVAGEEATVQRIAREDLEGFVSGGYFGPDTVISLAGPVDHEEVVDFFEAAFSDCRLQERPAKKMDALAQAPSHEEEVRPDLDQTHLALGFRGPGRLSEGRFAFRLLSILLGETMSSRLFQRLREQEGLCYQISTDTEVFDEAGLLQIYAGVDQRKVERTLDLLGEELRRIASEAPGEEEFGQALRYALGQHALAQESTYHQFSWVAESLQVHDRIVDPEETAARLAQVRREDLQALAADIFDRAHLGSAVIGRALGSQGISSRLGLP
ncbi:MAG: pitrilysin family protein [Verrucomicrobiota bacterium]